MIRRFVKRLRSWLRHILRRPSLRDLKVPTGPFVELKMAFRRTGVWLRPAEETQPGLPIPESWKADDAVPDYHGVGWPSDMEVVDLDPTPAEPIPIFRNAPGHKEDAE
jgi:hypothetical protein